MAPHESVEIRLVCKADYLDPQLKTKLHEIKDKLRQILHTGRRRFALKKVQPWNSVKVTFIIPKEAADQLRLLAAQGNIRLIELGILSVEIAGQSNTIVINNNTNPSTTAPNSKDITVSNPSVPFSLVEKSDDHRSKRIKIEQQPPSSNFMQLPLIHNDVSGHYFQRHERDSHTISPTMNSGATSNSYLHDDNALSNGGNYHDDSWSGYKMKMSSGHSDHYYPSPPRSNTTSTRNLFGK